MEALNEQGILNERIPLLKFILRPDCNIEKTAGAQLKEVDGKLKEIAPQETAVAQRKHQAVEELRRIKNEINEYQSKIKNIEDVDKNRLNMLRGEGLTPIYHAVVWLRENKNQFRAPIYEPPLISVSVRALSQKLKDFAALVDNVIVLDGEREAFHIYIDILRCSLSCFKIHKESPCEKPTVAPTPENLSGESLPVTYKFPTSDTVPIEKLQALVHSDEVKDCLSNPHVRNILKSLVLSQTPETSITDAMKEPIFLELAHACLKIVEPETFQQELDEDLD
uniref:EOG090X0JQ4 n=1 Tax=Daphnia dolichocephala TaxID=2282166 RepID=A0A4Y7M7F1_9CRUS|nr:EOG090X0JQ4 [Daphnia dolichocephala]